MFFSFSTPFDVCDVTGLLLLSTEGGVNSTPTLAADKNGDVESLLLGFSSGVLSSETYGGSSIVGSCDVVKIGFDDVRTGLDGVVGGNDVRTGLDGVVCGPASEIFLASLLCKKQDW